MTAYMRLSVAIYNSVRTPKEIAEILKEALKHEEEIEILVDEHTGECSEDFCLEHS
jgi:hypothetical protein